MRTNIAYFTVTHLNISGGPGSFLGAFLSSLHQESLFLSPPHIPRAVSFKLPLSPSTSCLRFLPCSYAVFDCLLDLMPSYLLLFTADLKAPEPKGPPAFAACLAFLLDVLGSLPVSALITHVLAYAFCYLVCGMKVRIRRWSGLQKVLAELSLSFWGMVGPGDREMGSAWR